MKKSSILILGLSLITSVSLYAGGSHGHEHKEDTKTSVNNHMGDHMHEGKMMNHSNPNGMTDKQMDKMKNSKDNDHMGDHLHEGKMMNHSNPNGMTNKEMNEMK